MNFSIAMATYNGSNYVLEQLESFARQTYQPYELVICDDGSTDNTIEIIESFAQTAPFIVRIYKNEKNLGYVQNFAKAISLCEGDWIALSDHDDVWFDEKLSEAYNVISKNHNVKLLIHDYILTDKDLKTKPNTNMERLESGGEMARDMISGCATIINKTAVKLALPIPSYVKAHDSWLHGFFRFKPEEKYVLRKPLIYYRRHSINASNSFQSTDKKQTKFGKLLHHRTKNALPGYLIKLDMLNEMKARMRQYSGYGFDLDALDSELELTQKRVAILKSGFPKRQVLSLRFLLLGGYKKFNGLISFVNDFMKLRAN